MQHEIRKKVFILNVSKRIFNVLEKANNNNKLIIVEHLVFSQIRRITEYKTARKIGKKNDQDKNDTKNCTQKRETTNKRNPFH